MVKSLHTPDQPLDGGDPIENLTGNLKRKFQFMIVSFDTIIVNRLRVFCKSKIRAKARLYPDRRRGRNRWEKSSARPYPRFANTFFS